MEIILLEDSRNLGKRGEVVKVKPGYARNFLIPQGIALVANKANKAYFEQQRRKIDARHAAERAEAMEIAAAISNLKIEIAKRVGESGTLYGSVTNVEIAERLEQKGVTVDRRRIDLGSLLPRSQDGGRPHRDRRPPPRGGGRAGGPRGAERGRLSPSWTLSGPSLRTPLFHRWEEGGSSFLPPLTTCDEKTVPRIRPSRG